MKIVYVLLLILFSLSGCKTGDFRTIRKEILSLSPKNDVLWRSYQLKKQIFKQLSSDIIKNDTIIFLERSVVNSPNCYSIYFSNDQTVNSYTSEYPLLKRIKRINANKWHEELINEARKGQMEEIIKRSKKRFLTPSTCYTITMITRSKDELSFKTYRGSDFRREDIP